MRFHRPSKLVLKPSPAQPIMLLFLAAVAALCGVGVVVEGMALGWLVAALGGLAGLVGWRLLASSRRDLRLNQSGFAFGTLLGRVAYCWCDVQSITVVGFAPNRLVTITLVTGVRDGRFASLRRRVGGFDRLLTETYGLTADDLARLLESWRARYGKRHINPSIVPESKVAACV